MTATSSATKPHCLTTGAVREKYGERGVRRYLFDEWREQSLPVNTFLFHHPEGWCLFDAGQTSRAQAPGYLPRWHPFLRLARFELSPEDEAAAQLRQEGIDPADVRWVVLSHLHTDHVGGLAAFTRSEILVTRTEWQLGTGMRGRLRGYLPQHWPEGMVPTLLDFTGPRLGPFPASHHLAAEGRIVLVPTPGHTKGHMAMLVRDGDGGAYLCCGDLVKSPAQLAETSPEIAEFCRREGITVLTTHDWGGPELIA